FFRHLVRLHPGSDSRKVPAHRRFGRWLTSNARRPGSLGQFAGGAAARSAEVDLTGQPQRLEVHFHEGVGVTHCELRSELVGWKGERVVDEVSLWHDPLAAREMHAKEVVGFYPDLTAVPSAPEGGLFCIL